MITQIFDPDFQRLQNACDAEDLTGLYADEFLDSYIRCEGKDRNRTSVWREWLNRVGARTEFDRRVWLRRRDKSNGALAAEGPHSAPLPVVYARDIGDDCISVPQIVEDTLTAGGLSVMYGASNSGKSYLAVNMSSCLALGIKFLGKRTAGGVVLYVAGEGAASIKMRVAAYKRHNRINSIPLAIVPIALNLLDPLADTQRVIDSISTVRDEFARPVALTVVDTLARAFGGGNENSSDDMGAVIGNADRIRLETGSHVMFVHHSGKDESKGSRGHSSLRAACDSEIEVTDNGGGIHTCEVVKQRDLGSLGQRLSGRFVPMSFGTDQWGKEQTVCIVEDAEPAPKNAVGKGFGKNQKLLIAYLRKNGAKTRTEARDFLMSAGASKRGSYDAIDSLLAAHVIADTVVGLRAKE